MWPIRLRALISDFNTELLTKKLFFFTTKPVAYVSGQAESMPTSCITLIVTWGGVPANFFGVCFV